jgi:hypothetical protein
LADPEGDFEHSGVTGMASFDTKKGVDLDIPIDAIPPFDISKIFGDEYRDYPRLYGLGQNGDYITLIDAFGSAGASIPGFPHESWHAQEAIVSRERFFEEDPPVSNATIVVDGLFEWCQQNPVQELSRYEADRWAGTEISFSTEALNDITLYRDQNTTICLSPVVTVSGGEPPLKTHSLTSDYHLSFRFDGGLPTLSKIVDECIVPFRDFLSLLMGFRAEILSISVMVPGLEKPVKVYVPFLEAHRDTLPKRAFQQMPFAYPKVMAHLQSMTEKWFELPDDARRASGILLGFLAYDRNVYLDSKFIAAASAFEAISRVCRKTNEVSQEEFERRLSVVRESIAEKKSREWAMRHLSHANSVAAGVLAEQMLNELDPYSSFIVPDLKRFKQDHRDARNAYVHQNDNVSNGVALEGRDLYYHTEAVLFVVWGRLLNLLGISPRELINALEGSFFKRGVLYRVQDMYKARQEGDDPVR